MRTDQRYQDAVDELRAAEEYFKEATGIMVDYAIARLDAAEAGLKAEIIRVDCIEKLNKQEGIK